VRWKISGFAAREIRYSAIRTAIKHAQSREKTQREPKISGAVSRIANVTEIAKLVS